MLRIMGAVETAFASFDRVATAGTLVLPLAPSVRMLLLAVERMAAMVAVTWPLLRAIDIVAGAARTRLAVGGRESAATMVPVGGKAAKATVLVLALHAHPRIDPGPARIRFVGFGAHSLDLEVFAYALTTSYDEFLAVQEDVYLRIIEIVAVSGVGFAFPSQTLPLASDAGLDRARDAEARARGWRERGERFLPEFPPEAVTALRASLDYPPNGAAVARER